ncbi:hypothetical protein AAVH_22979 [Aphelenchoides avenae]|nr:hypothetical protein AAVH_22979 [Aphelenchus avenae]
MEALTGNSACCIYAPRAVTQFVEFQSVLHFSGAQRIRQILLIGEDEENCVMKFREIEKCRELFAVVAEI